MSGVGLLVLGVVLLLIGIVTGSWILYVLGAIAAIIGVVLLVLATARL